MSLNVDCHFSNCDFWKKNYYNLHKRKNKPSFLIGVTKGLQILYVCLVYMSYSDQYQS